MLRVCGLIAFWWPSATTPMSTASRRGLLSGPEPCIIHPQLQTLDRPTGAHRQHTVRKPKFISIFSSLFLSTCTRVWKVSFLGACGGEGATAGLTYAGTDLCSCSGSYTQKDPVLGFMLLLPSWKFWAQCPVFSFCAEFLKLGCSPGGCPHIQ